jgi:hypothetical protein
VNQMQAIWIGRSGAGDATTNVSVHPRELRHEGKGALTVSTAGRETTRLTPHFCGGSVNPSRLSASYSKLFPDPDRVHVFDGCSHPQVAAIVGHLTRAENDVSELAPRGEILA